mmetsp:Transcript_16944/g.21620  ORF Transcript_16944/g.21620 Transcript_16944/m.21620 type:complete len:99 (+) Transcript_16944:111-407(+)
MNFSYTDPAFESHNNMTNGILQFSFLPYGSKLNYNQRNYRAIVQCAGILLFDCIQDQTFDGILNTGHTHDLSIFAWVVDMNKSLEKKIGIVVRNLCTA